jgi:hypothetical protein
MKGWEGECKIEWKVENEIMKEKLNVNINERM